jgi:hypothetical protein
MGKMKKYPAETADQRRKHTVIIGTYDTFGRRIVE